MFAITRERWVAVAFGLSAAAATAQGPFLHGPVAGCPLGNCAAANHGTYGPALFAMNPKGHSKLLGPNEPSCVGRSSYPLSDWHYIRQFCGPTLHPGTCYGYYQTKWRKWEDSCPSGVGGTVISSGPEMLAPVPALPPMTVPAPVAPTVPGVPHDQLPLPKEDKPKPMPTPDVPKVDPVAPPKVPLVPKESSSAPSPLPSIPVVPVPSPSEPGKISTTDAVLVPMSVSTVVPPSPEPRVVVPPTPR